MRLLKNADTVELEPVGGEAVVLRFAGKVGGLTESAKTFH